MDKKDYLKGECGIALDIIAQRIALEKIKESVRDAITKIVEIFQNIKWSTIPKTLLATALAAAMQISADLASSLVGNASQAALAMIQAILAPLLKLILAFPESLMSLVRIPQDSAIAAVASEREYLNKAQNNLIIISGIIYKWSGADNRYDYTDQMQKVVNLLGVARKELSVVIQRLDVNYNSPQDEQSAYFDYNRFQGALSFLKAAIDTIDVGSSLKILDNIDKARKQKADELYRIEEQKIKKDKQDELKKLSDKYYEKAKSGTGIDAGQEESTSFEKGIASAKGDAAAMWYKEQRDFIEAKYKGALSLARTRAEAKAAIDKSVYSMAGASFADEFQADLDLALENASKFTTNMYHAYLYNKKSQMYTLSVYNYKTMISNMLGFLIDLIRNMGNAAAKAPAKLLKKADEKMELVEMMFTETLESGDDENRFKMIAELSAGKQLLNFSKAMMVAGSTDELVKLINADELLLASDADMDKLLEQIKKIPDWKGQIDQWGTKLSLVQIGNPYATVVPKAAILALLLPPALFIRSGKKAKIKVREFNTILDSLFFHNSVVNSALNSYIVPKHPVVAGLEKALKAAGLLSIFAAGFGLKSLIANIVDMVGDYKDLRQCRDNAFEQGLEAGLLPGYGSVTDVDIKKQKYSFTGSVEDIEVTDPDAKTKRHKKRVEFKAESDSTNNELRKVSNKGMGTPIFSEPEAVPTR